MYFVSNQMFLFKNGIFLFLLNQHFSYSGHIVIQSMNIAFLCGFPKFSMLSCLQNRKYVFFFILLNWINIKLVFHHSTGLRVLSFIYLIIWFHVDTMSFYSFSNVNNPPNNVEKCHQGCVIIYHFVSLYSALA